MGQQDGISSASVITRNQYQYVAKQVGLEESKIVTLELLHFDSSNDSWSSSFCVKCVPGFSNSRKGSMQFAIPKGFDSSFTKPNQAPTSVKSLVFFWGGGSQ